MATAPTFTASTLAGSYSVIATVSGVSTSASFSLSNMVGAASSIVSSSGTPQSTVVGMAFATAMQATVKDQYGNPISGMTVTFAAPASGSGGSFAAGKTTTATTNALGVATAPTFTANTSAGPYVVNATVSGVSSSASFSLSNTAGAASSVVATAGTPQTAVVGTAFGTALQVTVDDQYGNPVSGATVTFTAPISGAGGGFASGRTATATTNSLGVATAPTFTANTSAGTYTVSATVPSVASAATFSFTNTAGTATGLTPTAGTPQTAAVNATFATAFQIAVVDRYDNPVSGVTVTFAAPTSGPGGGFAGGKTVTATTNALGVATAPAFTANTNAGVYTVTATISGVSPVTFSLTNNEMTSTTLAIQPSMVMLGHTVTFTATVAAMAPASEPTNRLGELLRRVEIAGIGDDQQLGSSRIH